MYQPFTFVFFMIEFKIYRNDYVSLTRVDEKLFGKRKKIGECSHSSFFDDILTDEELKNRKDRSELSSISRTKRRIKDICLSNNFELFATFTVNSINCDRFSLVESQELILKVFRKYRRKQKNRFLKDLVFDSGELDFNLFKYIIVTEHHENGAFHFHGMIKNIPISEFVDYNFDDAPNDYVLRKLKEGVRVLHLPFFDDFIGMNTFTFIENYNKCCSYCCKYMNKDLVRNDTNQVFFASKGLQRPQIEFMIDEDLTNIFGTKNVLDQTTGELVQVKNFFENDFCQKRDVDLNCENLNNLQRLWAFYNKNDKANSNKNITNSLKLLTYNDINYKIRIH